MDINFLHSDITEKIIKAYYNVYNTLGYGFLEKVYENAMIIELTNLGLETQNQVPISVYYEGDVVGNYFADIVVNNSVIIEVKAIESLRKEHECQLVNYLKATDIEVGLLINFGKEPKFIRRVLTSEYKNHN